jgi:hypothetical protein
MAPLSMIGIRIHYLTVFHAVNKLSMNLESLTNDHTHVIEGI